MYNEALIVDRIASVTGFTVKLAEERITNAFTESTLLPIVYVGHLGIKVKNPEAVWSNAYSEHENKLILQTSIQTLCDRSIFAETWQAIYNSLNRFTPYVVDEHGEYSFLTYLEGNAITGNSNRLWWQDVYGLIFPQVG